MKKIIITVLIVLVLISGIVVTVMYKMGEKFLNEMMLAEIGNVQIADTNNNTPDSDSQSDTNTNPDENNNSDNSAGKTSDTQNAEGSPKSTAKSSGSTDKNTSKNAVSNPAPKRQTAVEMKKTVLTAEKMKEIQEEISFSDKMTAATLAMKRLSSKDIKEIQNMIAGGLTAEKKNILTELLYKKFTAKEIKQIKELYNKYLEK